jgi:hypothetical protein
MPEDRTLRDRLIELRDALIASMTAAPMIEPGHVALLGHVGAALAAIDAARAGDGRD